MISKSSLTGPFGLSMAATALIVVFLLISLPSLFTAVFAVGAGSVEPAKTVESLVAKHDESMTAYRERFNGRSVFFKPPPPYRPPPPPPPEEKPVIPPPPPPPETPPIYGGPSLSAIFGDQAWFKPASASDKIGFILHIGEEKNGVKLMEVDAPWSVKVGHKGGEYTISLPSPMFDKKNTAIVSSTSSKFLLPVPGLGFLKIPVPKSESAGDAATAPASGDEVKPLPGDEPVSGRLQARPLDGRDAAAKPAREATGEEAGDETQSEAAPVEEEVEEAVEEKIEDETAPAPRPDPSPPPATAPARAAATALARAK